MNWCFSDNKKKMLVVKNMTNNTMHTFYNLSKDLYTHSYQKACG